MGLVREWFFTAILLPTTHGAANVKVNSHNRKAGAPFFRHKIHPTARSGPIGSRSSYMALKRSFLGFGSSFCFCDFAVGSKSSQQVTNDFGVLYNGRFRLTCSFGSFFDKFNQALMTTRTGPYGSSLKN